MIARTNKASVTGLALSSATNAARQVVLNPLALTAPATEPCFPSGLFAPKILLYTVILMLQFCICDFLFYGVSLAGIELSEDPHVRST